MFELGGVRINYVSARVLILMAHLPRPQLLFASPPFVCCRIDFCFLPVFCLPRLTCHGARGYRSLLPPIIANLFSSVKVIVKRATAETPRCFGKKCHAGVRGFLAGRFFFLLVFSCGGPGLFFPNPGSDYFEVTRLFCHRNVCAALTGSWRQFE